MAWDSTWHCHLLDAKRTTGGPLRKTWKPPANMPAVSRNGPVIIPATVSGFRARDAHLYLPPAVLVPNPPELPVLVMMMGLPGGPDQDRSAVRELNSLAQPTMGLPRFCSPLTSSAVPSGILCASIQTAATSTPM